MSDELAVVPFRGFPEKESGEFVAVLPRQKPGWRGQLRAEQRADGDGKGLDSIRDRYQPVAATRIFQEQFNYTIILRSCQ